ncbi:MAG: phospholipase D-like domain-containing protein [Candidatus Paceibacterota bacterium]|jgi:cardiolipin synthase
MPSPTSWKLYNQNEEAWNSMLNDCANAKESIVLEQFIFFNDEFGQKLIDVCVERAAAGVKVRFLWDAAGSFTFWGSNVAKDLQTKGIELLFWKTLIPGYFKIPNMRSWYLRNHRRTLVIDEKIGYTGSICVYDSFKNWRDTNVRLEGPVVSEMSNAFERMWARANSIKLPKKKSSSDREFRYITNYPAPGRRHIYATIIKAIRGARKNVYITTPYFVPTHRLIKAIKSTTKKGVDVRLIIPEKSDYYAVDLGARAFFKTLLQSGVRIFLYSENMIHSKSIVVDGTWATVGSMNMDSASMLYNFEANIVTTNNAFTQELTNHFINDLKETKEVSLTEWQNRFFLEKIPEILIRLVKKFL